MKKHKMKLKYQLSIMFIGVLGITILIMIVFIRKNVVQMVLDNTKKARLNSFAQIQNELFTLKSDVDSISQMIFLGPEVQKFCGNYYGMDGEGVVLRQEIGKYLEKVLLLNKGIHSIFIETEYGGTVGTERNYNYNDTNGEQMDRSIPMLLPSDSFWKLVKLKDISTILYPSDDSFYGICFTSTFQYQNYSTVISIYMKEEYIYNLFDVYADGIFSDIYLCDLEGNVVSGRHKARIGQKSAFSDYMTEQSIGSFVGENENGKEMQVVYQVIGNTGWIIVEEIPFEQYTKDIVLLQRNLVLLFLSVIVGAILLFTVFIQKITKPLKILTSAMERMRGGSIGYQIEDAYENEFGEIIECFNSMSSELEVLIEENRKIEEQKTQYAITALRSQINPHFLFNTINMIKWMAIARKADNIKNALEMLSILLKPVFKEKSTTVTIEDEVKYVENYIQLVNLRFGGNIEIVTNIPENIAKKQIPRFILQPLIENCVDHGFDGNYVDAKIQIEYLQQERNILVVRDNGIGISKDMLKHLNRTLHTAEGIVENGDRIGIANVNMQLKLLYGPEYGIEINSEVEKGTEMYVLIP